MANVNVTIRMNEELKRQGSDLFNDLGLTLNNAINVFVRQAVREQRIPFEVSRETPNETTLAAMKETEEICKHPDKYKSFTSVDDLMKDLMSE